MMLLEQYVATMRVKLRAAGRDLVELKTREEVRRFFGASATSPCYERGQEHAKGGKTE